MAGFSGSLAGATAATLFWFTASAHAIEVGIVGFQFSSETHARVANAAAAAATGSPSPRASCALIGACSATSAPATMPSTDQKAVIVAIPFMPTT